MNRSMSIFRAGVAMLAGLVLLAPDMTLATEDAAVTSENSVLNEGKISLGYKVVETEDEGGRASEYSKHKSGVEAGFELRSWKDGTGLNLDGYYLNESDYLVEADLNVRGKVRFSLLAEGLYHNLDHIPFDDTSRGAAKKIGATTNWVSFEDKDPTREYSTTVEQSQAKLRVKLGDYPAHVNLEYWQLERTGHKQMRYLDKGAGTNASYATSRSCNECHVSSTTRTLDRTTQELKGSVDAHLGPINVVFEQLYRELRDDVATPSDSFGSLSSTRGGYKLYRSPGDWSHDEDPESRLISSTLKLNTSLSGGLTGAGSFSVGQRQNLSELTDVIGVESKSDFYKGTADVVWVLNPVVKVNLRYRLYDLDNSNSDSLYNVSNGSTVEVGENIDITRATYAGVVTIVPCRYGSIKGTYDRQEIHRGNAEAWNLPVTETIQKLRLDLYGRPLGNSRLKTDVMFQHTETNNPAYGTSTDLGNRGSASVTYSPSARWGIMTSVALENATNDEYELGIPVEESEQLTETTKKRNFQFSTWLNPTDNVTCNFNYGYLWTQISQDMLFDTTASTTGTSSDYHIVAYGAESLQRIQTASFGMNWRMLKTLGWDLELRHVRSQYKSDPEFIDTTIGTVTYTDNGFTELSQYELVQTGIAAGVTWSPLPQWSCSLRYTNDDYDDKFSDSYDGIVQTVSMNLARSW